MLRTQPQMKIQTYMKSESAVKQDIRDIVFLVGYFGRLGLLVAAFWALIVLAIIGGQG